MLAHLSPFPPMATTKLETLTVLLRAASAIVDDLAVVADPFLGRLTGVFARMPAEDRAPILEVLEREVSIRLLARSSNQLLSGFELGPPDPNARLYARVFARQPPYETRDQLMVAVLRGIRMMLDVPARTRAQWEHATFEAFRKLNPTERDAIAQINRDMLAMLERAGSTDDVRAG